ncbi:MarR family winged helix-turn-helix transcriptional regulator [Paenibacillus arenilitoris]|nr:MarR family transcriptional regulator [Paenibacillus arenilitoris]
MNEALNEADTEKLALMRRLDESFRQVRRQVNAEWNTYNVHGLGMTHGRMLTILAESGPQKASALAEQLLITSGGVTGIADRLIELGYIRRTRGEQDRRVVMLGITDEGMKNVALIETVRTKIMFKLFDGMSIEEMAGGLALFERMNRNMESADEADG